MCETERERLLEHEHNVYARVVVRVDVVDRPPKTDALPCRFSRVHPHVFWLLQRELLPRFRYQRLQLFVIQSVLWWPGCQLGHLSPRDDRPARRVARTSRHVLYALHTFPHRFSYSSDLLLSLSCLWTSLLLSSRFSLLGCDCAVGVDDGAASWRYSENQWLKQASYFFFKGVHGGCSESMVARRYDV